MLLHAVAIFLSTLSQAEPDIPGTEPWVFHITGADEGIHVLIKYVDADQSYGRINYWLNYPWLAPEQRSGHVRFDQIRDKYKELPTSMNSRIRKGWLERGGIEVETLDGPVWIQGDEYELAQRSVALAKRTQGAEIVDGVDMAVTSGSGDVNAPGFFALWGMHIGIAVATLVLGGGVVWVTMLRTRWSAL